MSRFWEAMLRECEEPGNVIEELRRHLQALLDAGCVHNIGACDDKYCFYCGELLDEDRYRDKNAPDRHTSDCPYLAAKTYMDQPDA